MALKVSLRKANAIQTNINDLLKAINVKTSVEISEFQEPTVVLQSANVHSWPQMLDAVIYSWPCTAFVQPWALPIFSAVLATS